MKLSTTCPGCGKQYRNIKPELAGKKVRCGCGAVMRVGQAKSKAPREKQAAPQLPPQSPANLLDVDLVGDEMLGDELLGRNPESLVKDEINKRQRQAKIDVPKPNVGTSSSKVAKPSRLGVGRPSKPKPDSANEPAVPAKKKKKKHRPPVPIAHPTLDNDDAPAFTSTYDDLDSILNGAGDAAPVVARTEVKPVSVERNESTEVATESKPKNLSPLGFLAALASATLAFWFGMFVLLCRFQVVDGFLIKTLCASIRSINAATFETGEMTTTFYYVFLGMGWMLWVFAAALIIFSIAQFADAFIKLLFGRHIFSWADGLTAAAALSIVFVMVALIFAQSTYVSNQHRELDEYERPAVEEGEHLPNVDRLREKIDANSNAFRISMIGGVTVPAAVFVLSMVHLFAQTYEQKKKEPSQTVL